LKKLINILLFSFLICSAYGQKSRCDSMDIAEKSSNQWDEVEKLNGRWIQTGRWIQLDSHCKIASIDTFLHGKRHGISVGYMPDGREEYKYYCINGLAEGLAHFVDSDTLHMYGQFKNGKMDGEFLAYRPNGKLYMKFHRTAGVWDGEKVIYYDSGRVHIKKVYDNGELVLRLEFKDDSANTLLSERIGAENNHEVEGDPE